MISGPTYLYECPNCQTVITRDSISSGNTFGAVLYSDGKTDAPMLPGFPDLTKCRQCQTIFWLSKTKEIGEYYGWERFEKHKWPDAIEARFLALNDNFKALKMGLAENREEEVYIRRHIWWRYNDRHRKNKDLFKNEKDELRWKDNLMELLGLLDESIEDEKIMMAEIHRNLGDFEQCMGLLERIFNEDMEWIKEKLTRECKLKNRWLIKLYKG